FFRSWCEFRRPIAQASVARTGARHGRTEAWPGHAVQSLSIIKKSTGKAAPHAELSPQVPVPLEARHPMKTAYTRERRKQPAQLRSARWFAPDDLRGFGHRSRMMHMGYAPEDWAGLPVIAILNTWSDLNPCHAHFRHRVDDVKRGVLQAGGFPIEMPAITLAESFMKPTTMLYRNMLAMETEEQLRAHPVDGAVLMGGCDKTTP